MIGSILQDRYHIETELGRGGMGIVYQAQDAVLERAVAVKILSAAGLGTEGRARLMNEARAVAKLNHPHIVAVYDAGETQTPSGEAVPFVVMELIDGPNLHDRPPQDLDETILIARQICAALNHAHSHDVIHRDLKPENVMLGPDGAAKLMDFGLARSVSKRLTQEGTIMGTLNYMAPEMALGKSVDHRADLYAFGVMLYEFATGQLPFDAQDPVAIITQHLHAPVVPPRAKYPELPPALDRLIVELLAKEPDERPASAGDVLSTLDDLQAMDQAAVSAPEPAMLERIVRGRLVGREEEFSEARAMWQQTRTGQGWILLVSGEPGIGKTRFVDELVTQAQVSGGRAFTGVSYAEIGSPYAPFRQILRDALDNDLGKDVGLSSEVLADLATLLPELRLDRPDLPSPEPVDPQHEQGRLLDNLALFFTMLSKEGPILLVLDDAHWADSGSLSALRHLARDVHRQRLMIVATYREVELEEARAFHKVLLDLNRQKFSRRIKLGRLDRDKTQDLLATLFDEAITPEFLEGIYRETEGNPFFVEEVCKALIESGNLTFEDGRWQRPDMTELGVPQSIQVTIQSRLRILSEETQKVLEQAAILGREFDFETLILAADSDEDSLIDNLEESQEAQLIEEVRRGSGETFSFVHALIPATIVDGMRTLRRRRLHRRASTAVESTQPGAFQALAHHFIEAGDSEKGVAYLLKAGDQARTLYAHQEALDAYQQAIEHLQEVGDLEGAARILMKLGQAHLNAYEFDQARQVFQEGFILQQRAEAMAPEMILPPAPHALRLHFIEPTSLDPALTPDNYSWAITDQLFGGLVDLNPELDIVPDLARSWEVLDEGWRYRFQLRQDAVWNDGVGVTAGDFEYAWKRVIDPATGSRYAHFLFDIKGAQAFHEGLDIDPESIGIRALDDLTLEVELERPASYFLQIAAYGITKAVPKHALEKHGPAWTQLDKIVTNGPFELASWEPGRGMVLRRYDRHHLSPAGNIQSVELLPHSAAQVIEWYEEDGLDQILLGWLDPVDASRLQHRHVEEYVSTPVLMTSYLAFNCRRPPFDDLRVRKAFALAIDREHLANIILGGRQSPASGGFVPPGMPGHAAGIALPHDPNRARQLLAECGYPSGRGFPVISSVSLDGVVARSIVAYLHGQLSEILGVKIVTEAVPWDEFVVRLSEDPPDMWRIAWSPSYPDPDDYLRISDWTVRCGWQHEAFERLIDDARSLMDQEKRLQMYYQAQKIVVEETPLFPLNYGRFDRLSKPWVRRYPVSPLKGWYWKDVIIDPD